MTKRELIQAIAAKAGLTNAQAEAALDAFGAVITEALVADKKVAVIGHFPFAQKALEAAGEYICLERNPQPGDYPDSACEYLLPECDYVFISGSAFVNKTAPRLIELSHNAHTVLVGPSVPLNPVLFDHGVDTITGFVSPNPQQLDRALAGVNMKGMFAAGYRVHQHRHA